MFLNLVKEFEPNGEVSVMLALDTELIRKGILTKLTPPQLKVLLAIASHMDENGEAFPSMRYISDVSGVALSTVTTAIKGLLAIRFDGLPVLTRTITGTGARKKSLYNFVIDTENPVVEEEETEVKRSTAKNLMLYYCEEYDKEFGYVYKVQWQRETIQMKNLMKSYNDEEIRGIIFTVITQYKKRWSKPMYPAPTLGALCGWMAVPAMEIMATVEKAKTATSKWDSLNSDEDLIL